DMLGSLDHHVRPDERPAADARPKQPLQVDELPNLIESEPLPAWTPELPAPEEVLVAELWKVGSLLVFRPGRKILSLSAAVALQNADALTGLCLAECYRTATEASSDDNNVEFLHVKLLGIRVCKPRVACC